MTLLIARYLGLAPISFEHEKKNAILLSCSLLVNQGRIVFYIFLLIQSIIVGTTSTIYGITQVITGVVHDFFISMWIYTAITKLKNWKKVIHDLNLDKTGYRYNQYVTLLCFFSYFTLIVIEVKFSSAVLFKNVEMGYGWFNFHSSQCVNYLLVFVFQCMVTALAKKYNDFEDDLQKQINDDIIKLSANDMRIKSMAIGRTYKSLYDLNKEFNELFGYILLGAMCSFFSNILCGVQVFSTPFSDHVVVMHIYTFIIQLIVSLVSFISFFDSLNSCYYFMCSNIKGYLITQVHK